MYTVSEKEKVYKIAQAILEPEKLAHQICAKKSSNPAKILRFHNKCKNILTSVFKNKKNPTGVKI